MLKFQTFPDASLDRVFFLYEQLQEKDDEQSHMWQNFFFFSDHRTRAFLNLALIFLFQAKWASTNSGLKSLMLLPLQLFIFFLLSSEEPNMSSKQPSMNGKYERKLVNENSFLHLPPGVSAVTQFPVIVCPQVEIRAISQLHLSNCRRFSSSFTNTD